MTKGAFDLLQEWAANVSITLVLMIDESATSR